MSPFVPRRSRCVLPLFLLPLLLLACTGAPTAVEEAPAPPSITSEAAVADFEAVWNAVNDTYFDPEFNGVDWQGVHDELLPRATAATNVEESRNVIREMLGSLGQSHLALIPKEALPSRDEEEDDEHETAAGATAHEEEGAAEDPIAGGFGLDLRFREGRLLVTRVDAGGAAATAGIGLGWSLTAIGTRTVDETTERLVRAGEEPGTRSFAYTLRQAFLGRSYGSIGSKVEVGFLDGDDEEVVVELARTKRDVIAHAAMASLPTFYLEFSNEVHEWDGKRIGRIHFTNWFLPMARRIDTAVDEMRDCDGMIIDLRGNGGGAGAMTMGLAGHFFTEKAELGTMKTHDSVQRFRANPRRISPAGKRVEPFAGPLAILVDETSASASEMFSGGVRDAGRARVFGETTAGAVLPARTTFLPSGDAVLHAIGNYQTSKGIHLEGDGVIPDEVVPVKRSDLLEGRDAQLEAALRWIAGELER